MIPVPDNNMIAFYGSPSYAPAMCVDDDLPAKLLSEAESRATRSGHSDVAEYLNLRSRNDALRQLGISWLVDSFIAGAAPHMKARPMLHIEKVEGHRFEHGRSTMVGVLLELRHGVRCLTVEAGWVRGPGDGIMRNGALAIAHAKHFGIPKAAQVLKLLPSQKTPLWVDENGGQIARSSIEDHMELFLELK